MRSALQRLVRSRLFWQITISAVFLAIAIPLLDLESIADAFRGLNPVWVVPALLVFTLAKFFDSWRWRYLLRGVASMYIPQRSLFAAFLVGNMVNNLLPLRAGDVAKIQVIGHRYGASRAAIAASVFVAEATLDGAVLVMLMLLSLFVIGPVTIPGLGREVIWAAAVVAVSAFALAILVTRQSVLIERWIRRIPRVGERAARVADEVKDGLYALGGWRRTLGALLVSLPVWILESVTFALFGAAFGLDIPLIAYVLAMVSANLATSLPIALWNIGPYEALVAAALGVAGASSGVAFSFAFTVHVAMSVWIQVTGILALWYLGIRPGELLSLGGGRPPRRPDGVATSPARPGEDGRADDQSGEGRGATPTRSTRYD